MYALFLYNHFGLYIQYNHFGYKSIETKGIFKMLKTHKKAWLDAGLYSIRKLLEKLGVAQAQYARWEMEEKSKDETVEN